MPVTRLASPTANADVKSAELVGGDGVARFGPLSVLEESEERWPHQFCCSVTVKPGAGDDFVEAYRIVRPRVATVPGYHEEELMLDSEDQDKFVLASLWDSEVIRSRPGSSRRSTWT